jgi:hypothetical protein
MLLKILKSRATQTFLNIHSIHISVSWWSYRSDIKNLKYLCHILKITYESIGINCQWRKMVSKTDYSYTWVNLYSFPKDPMKQFHLSI